MEKTKLSSKGQLVVPKAIRDANKWLPGTEFTVEGFDGGLILRTMRKRVTRIEDVYGCLPYKGKPKTIEEMNQAIGKMVRERHARGRY